MNFLDNLKLSTKVLAPLLLMALLIVSMVWLAAAQMARMAGRSTEIVEHVNPAMLLQARASQSIQRLGYDVYRTLSYKTGTPEEDQAQRDFDATARAGETLFKDAAQVYPSKAADFAAFKARYDAIVSALQAQQTVAATTNGFTLGTKDTPADIDLSAEVARKQVALDRQIDGLAADLFAFSTAEDAQNKLSSQALRTSANNAIWTLIVLGLISVAGGLTVALWMTSRKIAAPIAHLTDGMRKLASGDLTVVVKGHERGDEVGLMAKAVQVFKDNALKAKIVEAEAERLRAETSAERERVQAEQARIQAEQARVVEILAASLGGLAQGDLTFRIEAPFDGRYTQIKADFNAAVASLHEAISAISVATSGLQGDSEEIASASDDLSRRTEQQAASLEETAAALDQITATVKHSATTAKQAALAVSGARTCAEHSEAVMGEAVSAMGAIEESAAQIAQIISVIDEIAFQTNLLALNAGVEAARAGDAGRGFAVVAQEVRALAQKSAEAAKQIKGLIASSSSHVTRGVKLVVDTGEALNAIVAKVGEINHSISAIAASSQEQATGLNHVNAAVNQMDQITQQNAAMVEQSAAAAASLRSETAELSRLVGRFRTDAANTAPDVAASVGMARAA